MNDRIYFFDSYATIEILKGSREYERFRDSIAIMTRLNVFEVAYRLLQVFGEKKADAFLKAYSSTIVDYDIDIIRKAATMKIQYKGRKLSMADCIGYTIAKEYGIRFLTGDKGFEDLENVEYVK